ncbi:tRNA lysidine(34) synthetase TilS [Nocardioides sp. SYSU D00038]|uniref:tRNA lysidine(34) synthetase TilS n=1 Tax=Nocardioides sp. SYSU D00038 TaxID=2812554 RepID=UPI001967E435|nr:tRNA lysidine(34) synthetase TilS [Nocardioides sp. SYSU D00038]
MSLHPSVAAVRLAVRRTLADLAATEPDRPRAVLVACSGGADSLALLAATVFEARTAGVRVVGVTVDHGLQDGSAEHAAHVVGQMAGLGVDETVSVRVQVAGDGGTEAAARRARYAVLDEVAERFGADVVLLGHTLDDQAETVLMGLARGSGGRSIAGMRRSFDRYRRPLLDVTRVDTVTACQVEGIEFWNDPHNVDPAYTRARVRKRVLPVLEDELGPGIAAALARTADQLRQDMDHLDDLADAAYDALVGPHGVDSLRAARQPPAVLGRVLRRAALAAGATDAELFRVHVQALVDLVAGPADHRVAQLPGHVTAFRDGHLLRFRRTTVQG